MKFKNLSISDDIVYLGKYRGFEIGIQKKLLSES
ncbi:superfamily II DNA and RNA helicase, partial [Clostridium botulinum]